MLFTAGHRTTFDVHDHQLAIFEMVYFQYNNSRMYFNSGLFGSPGGFGSAAAAAAAAVQSMSPGGGGGAGSGSGMPHHLFDAASFRSEHGFPGKSKTYS